MENLILLQKEEQDKRLAKVREQMRSQGIECALISTNSNIYYLSGRIFSGYIYLPPNDEEPVYFVKRPVHLSCNRSVSIRKPESIKSELNVRGITLPKQLGLELGLVSYSNVMRLQSAFSLEIPPADVTPCLSKARAVKTPTEIEMLKMSGAKHERTYRKIPALYQPGMTDIELQIEIERLARLEGCLGQFRIAGSDMEIYMGNILAGDNADAPSPYDFAMGGAGSDPSLPVGADGTLIRPGMSVMVDMNGNYTGYMTDMTRTFDLGHIDQKAMEAHQLSIDICHTLAKMGRPGMEAHLLYDTAMQMVTETGLEDYFMGHKQHAGFIGHGVGIEINELPVISPRSKGILAAGNAIALEPKFVIPGTGAVGIENTYIVTDEGMHCITNAPEEIIKFD